MAIVLVLIKKKSMGLRFTTGQKKNKVNQRGALEITILLEAYHL
jgi:hypothetical protein